MGKPDSAAYAYNTEKLKQFEGSRHDTYVCKTCPYCNGERDPTIKYPKIPSAVWFREVLKSPKYVVAPMVEQSELPFRMLCRKYGATLAYTPMFHSRSFSESEEYRNREFSTCPEDRPLFVQFCGHDADTVLAAARFVEDHCDAVDLNLGCPQGIAKRGFYGSFLMEHWDIIHTIIHTLAVELKCPVTAKMRVFDTEELTLRYAKMLKDAGAHLVCVHGRTREMKGVDTGLADLNMIRKVREHIGTDGYPVLANGNILTFADIEPNLKLTGCDGAMSAEALLWDPRLFANPAKPVLTGRSYHCPKDIRLEALQTAMEYLSFVRKYPVDLGFVKAHLFKICYHSFECFPAERVTLGDFDVKAENGIEQLEAIVEKLRELEATSEEVAAPPPRKTTAEKIAEKEKEIEAAMDEADTFCIDLDNLPEGDGAAIAGGGDECAAQGQCGW